MFGSAKIEMIRLEKEALLAQSEVHRQMLQLQAMRIERKLDWVNRGIGLWRTLRPWLAVGAPMAGWLLAKKMPPAKNLGSKAIRAWGLFRNLTKVWRLFGRIGGDSKPFSDGAR